MRRSREQKTKTVIRRVLREACRKLHLTRPHGARPEGDLRALADALSVRLGIKIENDLKNFTVEVIRRVQTECDQHFYSKSIRKLTCPVPLAKISTAAPKRSPQSQPHPDKFKEFYQSWEWKRLRYDVLKDRGRRCECCGTTAAHGARIVCDHVKPIRRYWALRLDKANIQILCDDCNMGKGSRDETDWRDLNNIILFPAAIVHEDQEDAVASEG